MAKCAEDRSLAIAHGLEAVFWEESASGRWQPRALESAAFTALIQERTSPAVQDALRTLLDSPAAPAEKTRPKKPSPPNPSVPPAKKERPREISGSLDL